MDALAPILIIAAGAFSILGGVNDWDTFMNNRRARLFVRLFGRRGARIFYIGLGAFLVVGGVIVLAGGG